MSVFAIGDLHLPGHAQKPMDIFGSHWDRHFDVIKQNWLANITPEDTVLIPGDISWAMQLKDEGKTAEEIFCDLDELRKRARLFVRLETLEYLKRGGRISKTSAFVGGILSIKPILTLNGEGKLETVGKLTNKEVRYSLNNYLGVFSSY